MAHRETVPRGRHAPPLEVRQDRQLQRLREAAAAVFARCGYAEATAEAIAREAGMSKATFYEHFANKEDCILALADRAIERLIEAMQSVRGTDDDVEPPERYRRAINAALLVCEAYPDYARTLVIEMVGAGARAMERRDVFFSAIASYIDERNAEDAAAGRAKRFASPEDTLAIVGAAVELLSRQLRTGQPEHMADLGPVIERVEIGILLAAE